MKKVFAIILALSLIWAAALAEEETLCEGIVKLDPNGADIDLNNDGTVDHVVIGGTLDEYNSGYFTVTVNGASAGNYGDTLTGDAYAVTVGWRTYVAVPEYGPSDDSYTHFFEYDGYQVNYIGGIPDMPESMRIDGDVITARVRGNVIQTWYRPGDFIIATGGGWDEEYENYTVFPSKVVEVPRAVYPMGTVVMLNKGITLQVSPIDGAAALHLDAGTRAVLAATDDVEWLYIVNDDERNNTENYSAGWIRIVDDFTLNTDEGPAYSWDLFRGLMMAD